MSEPCKNRHTKSMNIITKFEKPVRSFINCFDRAALLIRKQNFPDVSAVDSVKVKV